MRYWQVVSWCETEHLVPVAKQAEELGFEGLILADHIYYPSEVASRYHYSEDGSSVQNPSMEFPDPLISFAAVAAATSRLKMMTGIYILPLRHPIEVAKNVSTLATLSEGRFSLGIGSGWLKEEFEQFGVDFHRRGRRMDESMAVMRALWRGHPVSHQGEFFHLDEVQIRPHAAAPIIGGGLSGKALRRSALSCDGWYGPGNTLEELPDLIAQLKSLRESAGLPWEGYQVIAPLNNPPDRASAEHLTAMGVSGTVNYPFLFGIGPNATLQQKLDYMADFAHRLDIAP